MERTTLEFPKGITGVVGPNGCGKSNIVDALRWVLGEQSAKHLRGQSMEDVIFAGNDRYGPLGMAEVVITFDNEGQLEHQEVETEDEIPEIVRSLSGAAEIEVSRKLYRSGESEYQINGRTCRLRDITELFLGTGVGTKAYSIIEQGRVGQIVGAKPEELRLFIEEAAGTTLYRSRKQAAERKIERTRNNLLRVSDIVQELERQAASLKRQARGAERYTELRETESQLDGRLTAFKLRSVAKRATEVTGRLGEVGDREQRLRREAAAKSEERETLRSEREAGERRAETAQRDFYESKARVAELEQERRFLGGRISELDLATEQGRSELTEVEARVASACAEEETVVAEREGCAESLTLVERDRATAEEQSTGVDDNVRELAAKLEETKSGLVDALARRASINNELSAIARSRADLETRRERLQDESGSLATVVERLEADLMKSDERVFAIGKQLDEASVGKEAAASELAGVLDAKAQAEKAVERARAEVAGLRSSLESLGELDAGFVGYGEGVRAFMNNGGVEATGALGVVADILEIDPGYERAVAAVLEERLQNVIVPSVAAAVAGAGHLKSTGAGRASFLPLESRSRNPISAYHASPGFESLARHVKPKEGFEDAVAELFDGIMVVDSLEAAVARASQADHARTYVTADGEVLDASGVITGGSGRPMDEGILVRRAEVRKLEGLLEVGIAAVAAAEAELETVAAKAKSLGDRVSGLDRRVHELTVERVAAQGELELQRQNLERTRERLEAVGSEISQGETERRELDQRTSELQQEVERVAGEIADRERSVEEGNTERARLEDEKRRRAQALEALRVKEAELRQRREAFEMRLASAKQAVADAVARRDSLNARITRDTNEVAAAKGRLDSPELSLDEVSAALAAAQQEHERLLEVVKGVAGRLDAAEAEYDRLTSEAESARGERADLEVKRKECELETQSIRDAARERMGEEVDAIVGAVPEADEDVDALSGELERVRNSIRRLGVVNVGAVDELAELTVRLEELTAQRDDLERSIEDLQGTITRLNRLSKQRFKETFESVNGIFQKLFPKLFQGGKAWLSLSDETNLLETGVEIFVQPPGKKLGNLNLLSGGEKALTAVSLIFSLFLHKPSPFCVLDEVDAPLDDANIGRFASMVADMSGRSQFVLITHNKRTMECADVLYGVTMREPGVSKIVSVEMTRQLELGEGASTNGSSTSVADSTDAADAEGAEEPTATA